jgi:beta-lactamase regulating signal transducer with metallopeptidase domain
VDTILNWIWQGSAVAAGTTVLLSMARRTSAEARYRIWCAPLAMILLLPVLPYVSTAAPPDVATQTNSAARYLGEVPVSHMAIARTAALALYVTWLVVTSLRAAGGIVALRRAKHDSVAFPQDREADLTHWMVVRQSGRRTRLVVSDRIGSAAVLGVGSPLIAIAPPLVNALTDRELDGVVIHEWAHVQRHDDWANLVQLLVRVVAGWHPAIWWVDRQLRAEREAACDETAVRLTGSAKAYAACLARLAEMRVAPLILPVPSALARSNVRGRIIRVLRVRSESSTRRDRCAVAAIFAIVTVLGFSLSSFRFVVPIRPLPAHVSSGPVVSQHSVEPAPGVAFSPAVSTPATGRAKRPRSISTRPPKEAPTTGLPASNGARWPDFALPVGVRLGAPGANTEAAGSFTPAAEDSGASITVALPADSITMRAVTEAPARQFEPSTAWGAASDAGTAAGRGSRKAAVRTAGFFNRLGRKIAGAF